MAILLEKEIDLGNGLSLPNLYIKYKELHLIGNNKLELIVGMYASKEASYNNLNPFNVEKLEFETTGLDYTVNIWAFIHALMKNKYPESIDVIQDPITTEPKIKNIYQLESDIIIEGICESNSEIKIFSYGYLIDNFKSEGINFSYTIKDFVKNHRYSLRRLSFNAKVKNKKKSLTVSEEVVKYNDEDTEGHENALKSVPFNKEP